jgi:hypothetical protein
VSLIPSLIRDHGLLDMMISWWRCSWILSSEVGFGRFCKGSEAAFALWSAATHTRAPHLRRTMLGTMRRWKALLVSLPGAHMTRGNNLKHWWIVTIPHQRIWWLSRLFPSGAQMLSFTRSTVSRCSALLPEANFRLLNYFSGYFSGMAMRVFFTYYF